MFVTFTITQSTPSNEGKTFVWKLEANFVVKAFGVEKSVRRVFYIGGMPIEGVIGSIVKEDLNNFTIVERAWPNPETGEKMLLKWLHVKPY